MDKTIEKFYKDMLIAYGMFESDAEYMLGVFRRSGDSEYNVINGELTGDVSNITIFSVWARMSSLAYTWAEANTPTLPFTKLLQPII